MRSAWLALFVLPIQAVTVELASASAPVASAPVASVADERVIKVLRLWLKDYRRDKYDLLPATTGRGMFRRGGPPGRGARPAAPKKPVVYLIQKHALLPDGFNGRLDHRTELEQLCRIARRLGTADAARALLEVAAVGLDKKVKYTAKMAPAAVREIGEKSLRRMRKTAVTAYLAKAAGGNPGGPSRFRAAMQAAALRALGTRRSKTHRSVIEKQLASLEPVVRASAANALGRLFATASVEPLAVRLGREGDATAIIEILAAIDLIRSARKDVETRVMQMAVIEAGRALGRADSWPPDLAIVDFLEKYRYRDSIPLLIKLLERFQSEKHKVRSGRLPKRLQARAKEVLTALTGARIPMTAPDRWREFWEANKDTFVLPPPPKAPPASARSTQGFFNIPVQGKRVVFVIDVSGSMARPMVTQTGPTRAGGSRGEPKIDVAKRELWKAVKALPADVRFNVISYSSSYDQWQRKGRLVAATDSTKKEFKRWLDRLQPRGGTNIHDAMAQALKLKSALRYGQRYDSPVDEVFLLSDGLPTAGEITDPQEILRRITETNRFSRVTINTIYLEDSGGGLGRGGFRGGGRGGFGGGRGGAGGGASAMTGGELMKQMAAKNGGKYVRP